MGEDIGEDAKALGISPVDVAKIRKSRARQRILFVVVGSFAAVVSFVAGAIAKELTASSYPFAIGSSASISGTAVKSPEVDRRLGAFVVLLLAVASFVLGFLLFGGETETGAYPQGTVPEYGVYGS